MLPPTVMSKAVDLFVSSPVTESSRLERAPQFRFVVIT